MAKRVDDKVEVLLLSVAQAAVSLGLGRTKVYELIDRGELPVVRIGRAIRLRPESLRVWVEQCER